MLSHDTSSFNGYSPSDSHSVSRQLELSPESDPSVQPTPRHPAYAAMNPNPPRPPQQHFHPSQSAVYPDGPPPVPPPKRKHVCSTCDRAFTTSGHLARHIRIHTGERNHKCPFPGCETRCSRQDNLQQHYRIHLATGSRRSSGSAARAASSRGRGASEVSTPGRRDLQRRGSRVSASTPPPAAPSPPLEPPPLAPAYASAASSSALPEPPDTPPPLAQAPISALLPPHALSQLPSADCVSDRASAASTPDYVYPPPHVPIDIAPVRGQQYSPQTSYSSSYGSQTSSLSHIQCTQWESRSHPGSYYEAHASGNLSESSGSNYMHTSSSASSRMASPESYYHREAQNVHESPYAYTDPYDLEYPNTPTSPDISQPSSFGSGQAQHMHQVQEALQYAATAASSSSSRHSIAHISHPYAPSPINVSPTESHPPTPSYPTSATMSRYHETASLPPSPLHASHIPVDEESGGYVSAAYSRPQAYSYSQPGAGPSHSSYSTPSPFQEQQAYVHPTGLGLHGYQTSPSLQQYGRYHSPPPTLAPIRTVPDSPDVDVQQDSTARAGVSYYHQARHNESQQPMQLQLQSAGGMAEDPERLQGSAHYVPLRQPQPTHPSYTYSHSFYVHSSSLSYAHQNVPG